MFKQVDGRYLISVGSVSSLFVRPGVQMFEDPRWPEWYFDTASADHMRYLGDVTGIKLFSEAADIREHADRGQPIEPPLNEKELELRRFLKERMGRGPDIAQGCRAQFELYQGDKGFK